MEGPYLVDSNFFIEAFRVNYPFDVVPSFWLKVKELAEQGKIISIDKVQKELYRNNDELSLWIKENLPDDFFKSSSESLLHYSVLSGWVQSMSHQYLPHAITEFLDVDEADAWLIAYAMEHGNPIVTHEASKPNSKSRVMLPDAALPHGVVCMKTIDMLRLLHVSI